VPLVPGKAIDFSGPEYKASLPFTADGLRILQDATIFLVSSKDWVDGDAVEVDALANGKFSYTTALGAQATVRQYKEAILPPAPKKPAEFNPGSMNPPH
jgi:hypothetical protein